jgi:hypothetical protein
MYSLRKNPFCCACFPFKHLKFLFDHVISYFYFNRCQNADRILYGIYMFPVSFTYLAWPYTYIPHHGIKLFFQYLCKQYKNHQRKRWKRHCKQLLLLMRCKIIKLPVLKFGAKRVKTSIIRSKGYQQLQMSMSLIPWWGIYV